MGKPRCTQQTIKDALELKETGASNKEFWSSDKLTGSQTYRSQE